VNERFHVDLDALNPIGRASGSAYVRTRDQFRMNRPFLKEIPAQLT